MSVRRCAFLTLEDRAGFYIYDQLLFAPLRDLGWAAEEIPWNRSGVSWGDYDAVIIRSAWDYQGHLDAFLHTLADIERQTLLFNPLAVCRWNSHKSYLRKLAARGVPIVPSRWEATLNPETLRAAATEFSCERLIAKPCVGANADHTYPLDVGDSSTWQAALTVFSGRELILQPFVDSIHSVGEYSLFYFGGEYSHAIRKRPASGDFRVQEEHGGLIEPAEPSVALKDATSQCLAALDHTLLYARLDFVNLGDGRPALMEMELIEPSLYFEQCDRAAPHFARVFQRMVEKKLHQNVLI